MLMMTDDQSPHILLCTCSTPLRMFETLDYTVRETSLIYTVLEASLSIVFMYCSMCFFFTEW